MSYRIMAIVRQMCRHLFSSKFQDSSTLLHEVLTCPSMPESDWPTKCGPLAAPDRNLKKQSASVRFQNAFVYTDLYPFRWSLDDYI